MDAVKSDNVEDVLAALHHAWVSGYDISSMSVIEKDDVGGWDNFTNLQMVMDRFFVDKIRSGYFDAEDRKKIYERILPYDIDLAYVLIMRIDDDEDEDDEKKYSLEFSDTEINPEELFETQTSHYEYLINKNFKPLELHKVLWNDGHLDDSSLYDLNDSIKRRIVDYAKDYMKKNPKNDINIPHFDAAKFLKEKFEKELEDKESF